MMISFVCPFLPRTRCIMEKGGSCYIDSVAVGFMSKTMADYLDSPPGFDLIICRPKAVWNGDDESATLEENRIVFFVESGAELGGVK